MPNSKKKTVNHNSGLSCPPPKGILIAIGGREQKGGNDGSPDEQEEFASDSILQRFVDELRGDGPVVVVPTASEEPVESGQDYVKVFTELGVKRVEVLDIRSRDEVDTEENMRLIDEAAGIMFTGGDQLRLTAIYGGTDLLKRIKERYTSSHFVIAGTSAGAAAMSTPMLYQGRNDAGYLKDEIHVTTGLQFLHDVAIDTHFVARGRIVRMAQVIATNPGCVGLGLEEDTAVVVTDGSELEVIGNGIIVVVDGRQCNGNTIHLVKPGEVFSVRDLHVHLLARGERYTLPIEAHLHR
ncbi:cyanophycinase [Hymenobacter latericus]|uniref:cyanophycinase n=1 Tax=Hymenobacter sp. YIM 151858-1 TaxID=2987688 RepID=UPI002225FF68|nr:cyanophycinase [Hymenobacter sp. YIM 151858-1]UYZ58964.1 cyanophycinase [Hymenobacter sp. YIM 151858-1]